MVWFPPNTRNSRFFAFSPMIFVLKLLSWSSKLGARWTYHLNHTNLLQKEFWKILHDFYLFIYLYKVTNEEFKTSQNDGINLYFMLIDLLQLPLQMYFNENLEKKSIWSAGEKDRIFLEKLAAMTLTDKRGEQGEGGAESPQALSVTLLCSPQKVQ